jgi:hypothetical protein
LDSGEEHSAVTELALYVVELTYPSDGGLDVLRTFFSRSDTTLTKVFRSHCDFGSQEDASQLLAAFQTNEPWWIWKFAASFTWRVLRSVLALVI